MARKQLSLARPEDEGIYGASSHVMVAVKT